MWLWLVEWRCGSVQLLFVQPQSGGLVERIGDAGHIGRRAVEREKQLITDQVLYGRVVGLQAGRVIGELTKKSHRIGPADRLIGERGIHCKLVGDA